MIESVVFCNHIQRIRQIFFSLTETFFETNENRGKVIDKCKENSIFLELALNEPHRIQLKVTRVLQCKLIKT